MGRVLTNNVSMSYSIETALGVAGTSWFLIEPNAINNFGAEITTVARNPISRNRQRRKGTVTDLDSAVEIEEDWTLSSFRDFAEGFCFATGINTDVTQLATTAAETTGDSYAVAALSAGQADKFEFSVDGSTLIWVTNYLTAANNGLKVVDADIATSAVAISVAENLVDETAPANAKLSFAGFQIAAAATPVWTYSAPQATLSGVVGLGTTLIQLGLTPGQTVHVGSIASAGSAVVQNAFQNAVANDMFGYARVVSISANSVVFDKLSPALQFTDAAIATAVDLVFGEFIRNVATTSAEFLERSFQFEAEFPNLDVGGASKFQYSIGNFCDTAVFSLPGQDKATVTFGFIGTDTENPVVAASRKTGTVLTAASGVLTLTGNALNTETVTIDGKAYQFQTVLTNVDGNVFIGATASDSIDNLVAAITLGAGAGTVYAAATTLHPTVTAAAGTGDTMDATAKVAGTFGNFIATLEGLTNGSWGATTLLGGLDGTQNPTQTGAFNTSSDIARLRVTQVDETGLTTDFKSLTMTLGNEVSPEKVLAQLGAKFMNTGNFLVDLESELLFTESAVIDAIRDNTTVTMDFIVKNDDGVVAVDVPSMTLGGGARSFPENESVLISVTGQAFQDVTLGSSIGISIFPIPLP